MLIVTSMFSLSMLRGHTELILHPLSLEGAKTLLANYGGLFQSYVGHKDTCALFAEQLGIPIEYNRGMYVFVPEDVLLLGQYQGPRLPEGATTLPEGTTLGWWQIEVAT